MYTSLLWSLSSCEENNTLSSSIKRLSHFLKFSLWLAMLTGSHAYRSKEITYRIKIQCIFQNFPVYTLTNICSNNSYILHILACYYYNDFLRPRNQPDSTFLHTEQLSWSRVRNEIKDCTHSPFTDINAKDFQITALRESGYWAKPVVRSVTENFTVFLKTKCYCVL